MSERPDSPDDTPDFLAKPASPSSEHTSDLPPTQVGGSPSSPYVSRPDAPGPGYQHPATYQGVPGYQGPPQPGYAPYAPVPGLPGYPFAQSHGSANTAMGLGIASVVCAITTPFLCITMPGVFCGPFAIALGVRARKEMQQNPGRYNNEGAATTGLITGIVGTVLGLAMIGLVIFFIGAVFSFGSGW